MNHRHFTAADNLIANLDNAMRTMFGQPHITERPNPAQGLAEADMSQTEKRHAAGLMRVNHAGEVSAQGLYSGQALTARLPDVREKMERAALEENDHLDWCGQRLDELDSHKSLLNPLWYCGAFAIGAAAGAAGDKWSLGFVAETEHQVVRHLDSHLHSLPPQDVKSRAVVEQMKQDEAHHATVALQHGGAQLPAPLKKLMGLTSKVMTTLAYRI
ncbi:2-octaprenyl-3-methyl-6-methoxy-1,4-benzoquinol hydroxylase [Candidatus Tenderia electrophaga]|uniref:3-demethoxyubiquinol 3-hydroxylase n=1 Tax=Candidatus Tenderia electrophaga TaxID=1748243 RepID=A0A0S2TID1_9GAMM|nr:2-octaprenyl-3-methyl-6-methoxy-1,4-benzoquinol hydroxylase [Candidatus Tenderia electrophaga]